MYGAVVTTGVPIAMAAKSPLLPPCTVTLLKDLTLVAVFSDFVSKVAVPAMFTMPVIGTAWTTPAVSTTAAIVRSVFDNFIILLGLRIFIANNMYFYGTSTDDGKKQPSESTLFSSYFRNLSVFTERMEKEWPALRRSILDEIKNNIRCGVKRSCRDSQPCSAMGRESPASAPRPPAP
jgi:hypothetical protein